jgi:hypothetical protein
MCLAILAAGPLVLGCGEPQKREAAKPAAEAAAKDSGEITLFDGKSLKGWIISDYPGHGKVNVKDGTILLEEGEFPITGVTWKGAALPKTNYEITLDAMRVDGSDFFCGLTFPVKNSFCSFIVGGWGGKVLGLSCLNDMDAANNETCRMMDFENGKWYYFRVRVTDEKIEAWINGDQVVNSGIEGRRVSVRFDVEPSCPFGVAAYRTKAAIRNIQVKTITE